MLKSKCAKNTSECLNIFTLINATLNDIYFFSTFIRQYTICNNINSERTEIIKIMTA